MSSRIDKIKKEIEKDYPWSTELEREIILKIRTTKNTDS